MVERTFRLQLLATPELQGGPEGNAVLLSAGKPLALLTYLALAGKPASREELGALLWPKADRTHARASVRHALWLLRKILGDAAFASDDPVQLQENVLLIDLHEFRQALSAGDPGLAEKLWEAPPFLGLEFPGTPGWMEWTDSIRTQEEKRFGDALTLAARAAADAGKPQEAVRWLTKAVDVEPYQLAHRTALIESLLGQHAYSEAEEAISDALLAFEDQESQEALGVLNDRLAGLRVSGLGSMDRMGVRTEFVGRTAEFSALASEWRGALRGQARVGLITGAPGIGKTRLAEELFPVVQVEGGRIVTVKAVEVERALDWGTTTELVRTLHSLPGAAGITNRSAAVLTRLAPSLGFSENVPAAGSGGSEPAAVTDALLDLVGAVAEEQPLFLLVDDLQWVDKKSRAALSHLGRSLLSEPVFLLFTCRSGERDPEVEKALESLRRLPNNATVHLGPLRPAETSELLAHFLDDLEPEDLDGLAQRIHGITQGNPLFIVEILKFLHSEHLLQPKGGGRWRIDTTCLSDTLPVPKTVESAVQRRLEDLGPPGRVLAAHLADLARSTDAEDLRRRSGLSPFEVSEGIRQLFQLDLVRRSEDGRIGYLHDSIAAVARRYLAQEIRRGNESGWGRRRRGLRRVLSASALLLIALSALVILIGGRDATANFAGWFEARSPDYPFGQGSLLVRTGSGDYWLTPPERREGAWSVGPAEVPFPHSALYGPFRMPEGSLSWFARGAEGPDDPPFIGIPQLDGTVEPLWEIEGDVGFVDLSPDGTTLLLVEENLETPEYDRNLLLLSTAEMTARTLYEGSGQISGGGWSPDGHRIVFLDPGRPDPLVILGGDGGILGRRSVPGATEFLSPSWCSDSEHIAFRVRVDGRNRPGVLSVSTGEVTLLPYFASAGGEVVACLGRGAAVAFAGAIGTDPQLLVYDVEGDSLFAIPEMSGRRLGSMKWVPEKVDPVLTDVRIAEEEIRIERGARLRITALGQFSDGVARPVEVAWEALDPSVVSVDSAGVLTANRIGATLVAASHVAWISDTLLVTVTQADGPEVLLNDDFTEESLSRWELFGTPEARLVEEGGDLLLSLEGDGRWRDGLVSRGSFEIGEGATIELVFRITLNRPDRQRIGVCAGDSVGVGINAVGSRSRQLGDQLCMTYPTGEGVTLDPRSLHIYYSRTNHSELAPLPADLDPGAWTRIALQIRPDGQVSLFANGEILWRVGFPIAVREGDSWRLLLFGASVDTEALVRSVTVWRGTRYPEPPADR